VQRRFRRQTCGHKPGHRKKKARSIFFLCVSFRSFHSRRLTLRWALRQCVKDILLGIGRPACSRLQSHLSTPAGAFAYRIRGRYPVALAYNLIHADRDLPVRGKKGADALSASQREALPEWRTRWPGFDYDIGVIGAGSAGLTIAAGPRGSAPKTVFSSKREAGRRLPVLWLRTEQRTLIRTAQVRYL